MWQLTVTSSTATSSRAVNVWNSDAADPQDAADNLHTWYQWIKIWLSDDATYLLDGVARELNEANGQTLGVSAVNWPAPIVGTAAGTRGPDATAVLVNHDTAAYVGGRRLQGRTFLPYPSITSLGEGQIGALALTNFQDALDNGQIALTTGGFGIWKRPQPGVPGTFRNTISSQVRREYSYIGGRRD